MIEGGPRSEPVEILRPRREVASSVEGKIKEVAIAVGLDLKDKVEIPADVVVSSNDIKGGINSGLSLVMIKNLLQSLPREVALKIVVWTGGQHGDSKTLLENWREALRLSGMDQRQIEWEIIENQYQNLDKDWIRDYFLLSADGKKMYVPQYAGGKKPQHMIHKYLAELAVSLGLEVVNCPFAFEGGDIKSVGGKMYISMETILANLRRKLEPRATWNDCQDVCDDFSDFFGTEVVLVGADYWQKQFEKSGSSSFLGLGRSSLPTDALYPPLFHLDLYYTPLGHNQVAVGDVSLLLEILKREDDPSLSNFANSVEQSEKRKEEELAGFSNVDEYGRRLNGAMLNLFDQVSQEDNGKKPYARIQDYLDAVVAETEKQGLEVIRVPLLPAGLGTKEKNRHALITYNNCLVENYTENDKKTRQIWLPSFGMTRQSGRDEAGVQQPSNMLNLLDQAAERIYRQAGLEVQKIDSGLENTVYGGSLNCRLMEFRKK